MRVMIRPQGWMYFLILAVAGGYIFSIYPSFTEVTRQDVFFSLMTLFALLMLSTSEVLLDKGKELHGALHQVMDGTIKGIGALMKELPEDQRATLNKAMERKITERIGFNMFTEKENTDP